MTCRSPPPLAFFVSLAVYASLVAIPLVFIHGVFTYGAFGVRSSARAAAALRSSSLLIGLLYVFAVAAPALLLGHQLTLTEGVVLTVAMAVALQPLRSRVTRFVRGRVMSDPDVQLAVLARLGARLEHTVDLHRTLDELAEAIRDGLRASWARITPAGEDAWASPELTGQAGTVDGPARESRDLLRGGVPVGRIEVGPRRTGEYAPRELELLTTVAGQAATAVANVALAAQLEQRLAELSASRARLVAAQDDERRRLERDLHDGIQQNVVALIAGLRLARNRLERGALDPDELASLQEQARETLSDLREIAHGIAPPVLGDSGLVAAVESRVARFPIPLEVIADPATRQARLDPALEAAAYYVVQESLTNVAKHASARRARVTIGLDASALLVEIQDDGHGFDADRPGFPGGLTNIRDRIEAAGGRLTVRSGGSGTVVSSSFPLTTPSPPAAARSPEPIASVSAHG